MKIVARGAVIKLPGKIAIVTGGSKGIGKATAALLAKEGARVVITAKDQARLESAARESISFVAIAGDIRKDAEVENVVRKTIERFGKIDILVNNAGLKSFANFEADAYSASKAALVLLTKAWAVEYAKYKIRVNCVCPGIVETDMTKPYLRNEAERSIAEAEYPIGRIGTPDDVAKAILYLVSEDASWVTGAVLPIDGGALTK